MKDKDSDCIIAGIILIYTIVAFFAFKMHDTLWSNNNMNGSISPSLRGFITHQTYRQKSTWEQFLQNSVCPFGKFGAWMLISLSLVMIILLFAHRYDESSASKKKRYQVLAILNLVFALVFSFTTLFMNWALFARSFPVYVAQIAVSVWLFQKSDCLT